MEPFTVEHFERYCSLMVFDDGAQRAPEPFQLEIAEDIFAGFRETWVIIPEGNSKTTFFAQLALYGADYSPSPWIPIGAASAKQARIMFDQAEGFVQRTPGMTKRFRCFGGYLLIRSLRNGGRGIEVFAADKKTGDGVIPFPFALVDELHRQADMGLYGLWKGKLRKRHAQILACSTAGEPETPFELQRDEIRRRAQSRKKGEGSHMRYESPGHVMHEWMVPSDELTTDMEAVAAANPLPTITPVTLAEDFASPTLDLGDWKRLKCNRPTRATATAITDKEWEDAEVRDHIPEGAEVILGADIAFKWDTTAIVPLWKSPKHRLVGDPKILIPPRDGTSMHPDEIKAAFTEMAQKYKIHSCVMDMSKAEDIAHWVEDELKIQVWDHPNGNNQHVADYNAVMGGLRNKTLKHTGDPDLRAHALNAIARRLPGGDHRFDRPVESRRSVGQQNRRVIDGLTATAMAVEFSERMKPKRSVYEERYGIDPDEPPVETDDDETDEEGA